ncbi:MAG: GIY-YIG nuclease family protein [Psychrobacter sp.]|nr:GIY-YIG nuclease family protein [Psychrobacter sp.]
MNPSIPSAKTIQIYLPKGNPRGLRLAEMTTRTVRLIEIPRIHINDFFAMPDANQVGLYFLVGDSDSTDKPLLYIGQTGDLKRRLNQHVDKDFWTRAFVMLSTNNSMTQTHALYMEHKAIATAIEVGRYELKNGNNGNKPHTPDPLRADCEELFHTLDILLSTLGQPIFESININSTNEIQVEPTFSTLTEINKQNEVVSPQTIDSAHEPMLFYFKTKEATAKGFYDDDGFVVLAGSLILKRNAPSIAKVIIKIKNNLLKNGVLREIDDNVYELMESYLFKTPSEGSQLVAGCSNNGWTVWKNASGQTLSDIYR